MLSTIDLKTKSIRMFRKYAYSPGGDKCPFDLSGPFGPSAPLVPPSLRTLMDAVLKQPHFAAEVVNLKA